MSTQSVTEKILKDAKNEAKSILKKHKETAEQIREDREKRITAQRALFTAEAEGLKESEITRSLSQKRLEYNKAIAHKKRELIMQVVREAVKSLPLHKEYETFLKVMIKKSGQKDGDLVISSKDWNSYGLELKSFFKKEKMNFATKPGKMISGGVTIQLGKKMYHGSLDLIVELLHDELTIAVSKELF